MKKTEEQLANELDLFLTAHLKGQPLPEISEELTTEVNLAANLLDLAAQSETDSLFLSGLEARLAAEAARQKQQNSKQEVSPTPFWENIIQMLKDRLTMKRTVFALGAAFALFIFAFVAWSAFQGGGGDEPGIIVENPTVQPEITPTAETIAALPTLPSLSNASGLGGGFGGGGGGEGETAPSVDISIYNPLAETEFTLNSAFPLEPTGSVVYQQLTTARFTVEDVSRLAAIFGLSGPIYTETYYMEEGAEWTPIPVYQVFDGSRQLAVGDNYLSYYDDAGVVFIGSGVEPMPYEQAAPIAEAFLQQTGLADFPYQMINTNGSDIQIRRLIDGRETIYPEIQISVNSRGEVWSFSYNPLGELSALGEYPLRSAEDAWQHVLDKGVDFQTVFFNSFPGPDFVMPEPPTEDEYRYWQRTYQPGEAVTFYPYPMVFTAVNGDAPPRIILEMFILSAPADQLEAIAGYVGRQIYVEAIAGEMVGNRRILELVAWEPVEKEYTFREGIVQRSDDQALLIVEGGETFIIPSAPDNLFDGEKIYVSGWIETAERGETPVFNWQGMGVIFDAPVEEPAPPVDGEVEFFGIRQATINEINLQYTVVTLFDEQTGAVTLFLQPVWQFKGLTDTGEIIEIYVQAVDESFVAPPAQ